MLPAAPADLNLGALIHAHALIDVEIVLVGDTVGIGDFAVHGVTEPENDAALDQVVEVHRIDDRADFGGDIDLVDPDASVGGGHLDHFGTMNAEGLGQGHAAAAAVAEYAIPAGHFADRLEHLAGFVIAAQPDPFFERIGARGVDQLVEPGIVEETVRRSPDRAPGTDRRQLRRAVAGDPVVGYGKGLIPGAGDNLAVRTGNRQSLASHLRGHHRGHGDAELVAVDLPVSDHAAHPAHGDLAREVMGHVLLARVGQLDRGAFHLHGNLGCLLDHLVLQPVAEAAAHVEHVHGDLLRGDAGDLADIVLDETRDLGSGPDLGAVAVDADDGADRFQRGMRQIGRAVLSADNSAGFRKGDLDIAVIALAAVEALFGEAVG